MIASIGQKTHKNIGIKIMNMIQSIFVWSIITTIVSSIFAWATHGYVLGILVLLCGSLASWIITLMLYGFGKILLDTPNVAKSESKHIKDPVY